MLICQKCNSAFHYDCLDPTVKHSIPSLILDKEVFGSATKSNQGVESKKGLIESEFKCD